MTFPKFSLLDQDGANVTLDDLKGGKTIVYFYPKDDTPGCTAEACGINESLPDFAGALIYGVSPDSPESHRSFADKYGLHFTLLADTEHALAEACGVWAEGRTQRTTFLIDENGVILHVWENVNPKGHEKEILAWL